MKKMNNKGFSLVELIVVIAIMAVLVGVLAPQFIKYVENSRRSTDISAAESIRSSILADIADQIAPFDKPSSGKTAIVKGTCCPSAVSDTPYLKSSKAANATTTFQAEWDSTKGTCAVYATIGDGTYQLTDVNGAYNYKNQLKSDDAGFKTETPFGAAAPTSPTTGSGTTTSGD